MRFDLFSRLIVLGLGCAAIPAQFDVLQTTPAREATHVSALADITWTLSAPVDPATVNDASVQVWGRWS